jgi:galactokinase
MNSTSIRKKFEEVFKSQPFLVQSPGRINLIGEHTDYNEGFVLPAAIDKTMVIAVAKNGTDTCRLFSYDYDEPFNFSIHDFQPVKGSWANYIMGVVDQFLLSGHPVQGFDCVFGGDIPIGAGLSSSAALECGVAYALNSLCRGGLWYYGPVRKYDGQSTPCHTPGLPFNRFFLLSYTP